jgi:hypothetical protein
VHRIKQWAQATVKEMVKLADVHCSLSNNLRHFFALVIDFNPTTLEARTKLLLESKRRRTREVSIAQNSEKQRCRLGSVYLCLTVLGYQMVACHSGMATVRVRYLSNFHPS